jgi:hypothetical protein
MNVCQYSGPVFDERLSEDNETLTIISGQNLEKKSKKNLDRTRGSAKQVITNLREGHL